LTWQVGAAGSRLMTTSTPCRTDVHVLPRHPLRPPKESVQMPSPSLRSWQWASPNPQAGLPSVGAQQVVNGVLAPDSYLEQDPVLGPGGTRSVVRLPLSRCVDVNENDGRPGDVRASAIAKFLPSGVTGPGESAPVSSGRTDRSISDQTPFRPPWGQGAGIPRRMPWALRGDGNHRAPTRARQGRGRSPALVGAACPEKPGPVK
jgi:hypothetical protein